MFTWEDTQVVAADFETSGARPEFALQPWRIRRGEAWATSLVWLWPEGGRLRHAGGLHPSAASIKSFPEWALDTGHTTLCGWNLAFDLSVLLAYGVSLETLCRFTCLDGMLLWRHVQIEPEYDDAGPKKRYGLKDYVREFFPEHADYEQAVDYHSTDPAELTKLHEYNVKDCAFTLRACKALWGQLTPRQQNAAWIEAAALPLAAQANLEGLLVDTISAQDLRCRLAGVAAERLATLAPHGMTEQIVRSPQQLAKLMFDDWRLPVYKMNPRNKKGEQTRSTDKEVLHELSFVDDRVRLIKEYREALGNSKKFAETPVEAVAYNGDGRAHPLARIFGTYSGRLTYASKQRDRRGSEGVEEADDD